VSRRKIDMVLGRQPAVPPESPDVKKAAGTCVPPP
jgi:hypothetical protein